MRQGPSGSWVAPSIAARATRAHTNVETVMATGIGPRRRLMNESGMMSLAHSIKNYIRRTRACSIGD